MAASTIKSNVYSVTTPSITVSASTNITDYIPINSVPVEVSLLGKTAFTKVGKNIAGSQWWVQFTDWEGNAITGSYQLIIKYIV